MREARAIIEVMSYTFLRYLHARHVLKLYICVYREISPGFEADALGLHVFYVYARATGKLGGKSRELAFALIRGHIFVLPRGDGKKIVGVLVYPGLLLKISVLKTIIALNAHVNEKEKKTCSPKTRQHFH